MHPQLRYPAFVLFCTLIIHGLFAQQIPGEEYLPPLDTVSIKAVIVDQIVVVGNKKTNESIILRELLFKEGDTLLTSQLADLMKRSRENILKTSLFHEAIIVTPGVYPQMTFLINVSERWHWWIWPLIENPDRNFNDWWQHKDLSRLSAGLHFQNENFCGRREEINLKALFGYRTYLEGSYEKPFINKKKTIGIGLFVSYSSQREINYATRDNVQLFYHGDRITLKSTNAALSFTYRPGNFLSNIATFQYTQASFSDTVLLLNPDYLLSTRSVTRLIGLSYLFKADYRDNRYYPLKGLYGETEFGYLFKPDGSYNQENWRTSVRGYIPLHKRLYFASEFELRLTYPKVKPYFLQNALGFERSFVRGYEYLVIEGPHYLLFKSHLRYAVLPGTIIKLPLIRSEKFNNVPLSIYAGPHLDAGIVFPALQPEVNNLQNEALLGYGLGLDFVTYYDKVLRLEYTIRKNGSSGFFIHFMAMI